MALKGNYTINKWDSKCVNHHLKTILDIQVEDEVIVNVSYLYRQPHRLHTASIFLLTQITLCKIELIKVLNRSISWNSQDPTRLWLTYSPLLFLHSVFLHQTEVPLIRLPCYV